jgi:DNA-binding NarL/FixJ family response regulator
VAVEPRRVIILYDHPLLGEGLQRLLRDRADLDVRLVRVDGVETARAALEAKPDVVIVERCAPIEAIDLLRLAPDTLFIDVGLDAGPSWSYRREQLSARPEDILKAIAGRGRPVHGSAGR